MRRNESISFANRREKFLLSLAIGPEMKIEERDLSRIYFFLSFLHWFIKLAACGLNVPEGEIWFMKTLRKIYHRLLQTLIELS